MRSKGVVGKRIVRIRQTRGSPGNYRPTANDVVALELEDGTLLYPKTIEIDHGYYWHDFAVEKSKARERWPVLDIGKEHARRNKDHGKS